jgi:hypothetical protein
MPASFTYSLYFRVADHVQQGGLLEISQSKTYFVDKQSAITELSLSASTINCESLL